MQSMAYDVRSLYRYGPDGLREPNRGGAVQKWKRGRMYRVSMYPRESVRMINEYGISEDVLWLAIVNNTTDFKLGDRLGDAKDIQYEVMKIRTYPTSQQMEVREIWTEK